MSVTVEGVPETITREQYTSLVRAAGFEPGTILALEFKPDGIYAEVKAEDENGRNYLDGDDKVATHRVFVRVKDEE